MHNRLIRALLPALLLASLLPLTLPAQAAPDKVLARVNGEPIYESEVLANMPKDQLASTLDDLKAAKLDRLIDYHIFRRFLREQQVTVSAQTVDADIAALKKFPPSAGCMCCRYASLQQFLDVNAYTLDELRTEVYNNEGVDQYLRALWEKKYPTRSARLAYAKQERARLTQAYIKLWQIFFNTFQTIGYTGNPAQMGKVKKDRANAAWQRLRKGESFAAVAKAVSEDQMSRAKGGLLGCVNSTVFGDQVKAVLMHQQPGTYSAPVESIWGYHILKWAPMTDEDIVAALKQEFMDAQRELLYDKVKNKARVERVK